MQKSQQPVLGIGSRDRGKEIDISKCFWSIVHDDWPNIGKKEKKEKDLRLNKPRNSVLAIFNTDGRF